MVKVWLKNLYTWLLPIEYLHLDDSLANLRFVTERASIIMRRFGVSVDEAQKAMDEMGRVVFDARGSYPFDRPNP